MRVDNGKARRSVAAVGCGVAKNRLLNHRVSDVLPVACRHGKVLEGARPVVVRAQGQGVGRCLSVGHQADHNAVGANTVLVVGVVPTLDHVDLGLVVARRGGVSDGEAVFRVALHGCRVTLDRILGNGVGDLFAILWGGS